MGLRRQRLVRGGGRRAQRLGVGAHRLRTEISHDLARSRAISRNLAQSRSQSGGRGQVLAAGVDVRLPPLAGYPLDTLRELERSGVTANRVLDA